jgi:hypothetical protein
MSATPPPPSPPSPPTRPAGSAAPDFTAPDPAGRSLPLLLAAAGLVVAVTAAVLVFGVSRPPALQPLADHLDDAPQDALAWLGWGDDGQCLSVAWPDGTSTRPHCDEQSGELLGWVDDHTVLLASWAAESRAIEVDVRDGSVRGNRPRSEVSARTLSDGLTVTRERDELLVLGEDGTELWRVDAPADYRIDWSFVAPDGRHAALVDNAGRLLVVATDGSTPPRVWAEDVTGYPEPAWSSERVD